MKLFIDLKPIDRRPSARDYSGGAAEGNTAGKQLWTQIYELPSCIFKHTYISGYHFYVLIRVTSGTLPYWKNRYWAGPRRGPRPLAKTLLFSRSRTLIKAQVISGFAINAVDHLDRALAYTANTNLHCDCS